MQTNLNLTKPVSFNPNESNTDASEKNASWKKPLLYTALTVAGLSTAAFLAYKSGIFTTIPQEGTCPADICPIFVPRLEDFFVCPANLANRVVEEITPFSWTNFSWTSFLEAAEWAN